MYTGSKSFDIKEKFNLVGSRVVDICSDVRITGCKIIDIFEQRDIIGKRDLTPILIATDLI